MAERYDHNRGRRLLTARTAATVVGALVLAQATGPAPAQTALGQAELPVDLELILAVDASGSVDDREFALQLGGIAAAFRDPEVLAAIGDGYHRRIGVALMTWAETGYPKDISAWQVVSDTESAAAFAQGVESYPRRVAGGTGIGRAILFAVDRFGLNGLASSRKVIDLSGDGRETTFRDYGVGPAQARMRARARGVAINALAILNEDPDLEAYYRERVIHGPGAFTMAVADYSGFAAAMRRKLIREIRHRPDVSEAPIVRREANLSESRRLAPIAEGKTKDMKPLILP